MDPYFAPSQENHPSLATHERTVPCSTPPYPASDSARSHLQFWFSACRFTRCSSLKTRSSAVPIFNRRHPRDSRLARKDERRPDESSRRIGPTNRSDESVEAWSFGVRHDLSAANVATVESSYSHRDHLIHSTTSRTKRVRHRTRSRRSASTTKSDQRRACPLWSPRGPLERLSQPVRAWSSRTTASTTPRSYFATDATSEIRFQATRIRASRFVDTFKRRPLPCSRSEKRPTQSATHSLTRSPVLRSE